MEGYSTPLAAVIYYTTITTVASLGHVGFYGISGEIQSYANHYYHDSSHFIKVIDRAPFPDYQQCIALGAYKGAAAVDYCRANGLCGLIGHDGYDASKLVSDQHAHIDHYVLTQVSVSPNAEQSLHRFIEAHWTNHWDIAQWFSQLGQGDH